MRTILLLIGILTLAITAVAQNTSQVLEAYMQLKNALVKSDVAAATLAANKLEKTTKESAAFPGKEDLYKAALAMTKVAGQEHLRETFGAVSVAMWKVVKNMKNPEEDIYYQYCPMKDKYWLSREAEIKNPYYGSAMLSCGSVAAKKTAK